MDFSRAFAFGNATRMMAVFSVVEIIDKSQKQGIREYLLSSGDGGHKTSPGPRRGEKLRVYLSWWASSARMYRTGILMWPFLEKTISSKKFCPFGCYLHCISAEKTWKISQIVSVAQLNHKIGDLGSLIVQLRLVHCSVCLMRLKTMAKRSWKSFPSISIRSLSISVNPENCTMEEVELIKTTATKARPCLGPSSPVRTISNSRGICYILE
uniref:uncharacterized protein LOC129500169 isoform X2 n=1 Tax=Nyctereutes procyonoides TaxID=34880 RepID=UPI0024452440|nr:uncharacterized protein LOC129500169 isoform X2 [Nyctereutes procyonoides]